MQTPNPANQSHHTQETPASFYCPRVTGWLGAHGIHPLKALGQMWDIGHRTYGPAPGEANSL